MLRFMALTLFIFSTAAAGAQNSSPGQNIEPLLKFTGAATLAFSDKGFYNPRDPLVIKSQEEFEAFVAFIPPRQILKKETSQPSRDPLLKKPNFQWEQVIMVVVFDQRSLIFPPRILHITSLSGEITVNYRSMSRSDALEAKPQNIGSYTAAVIKRTDQSVNFRLIP